jgi:hypothetical protein
VRRIPPGLVAGSVAAVLSGIPSTAYALATGRDPLDATLAAGSLLLPGETDRAKLVAAAVPVHVAVSLGWGLVLANTLPRRRTVPVGAVAGAGIYALDMLGPGRAFARVRALPRWPQLADHVAYGAVVGWVLARLRASGSD